MATVREMAREFAKPIVEKWRHSGDDDADRRSTFELCVDVAAAFHAYMLDRADVKSSPMGVIALDAAPQVLRGRPRSPEPTYCRPASLQESIEQDDSEAMKKEIQRHQSGESYQLGYERGTAAAAKKQSPESSGPVCPKCGSEEIKFNPPQSGSLVFCSNCQRQFRVQCLVRGAEPQRWRDRAFEVLSALNMSVKWELAPEIKKEIAELIAAKERP